MHSTEPRLSARRFRVDEPHFDFEPGDEIEVINGWPSHGQYVLADLQIDEKHTRRQIAIYRKTHLELSNGLRIVGQMKKIVGIVLLVGKAVLSFAPIYLS